MKDNKIDIAFLVPDKKKVTGDLKWLAHLKYKANVTANEKFKLKFASTVISLFLIFIKEYKVNKIYKLFIFSFYTIVLGRTTFIEFFNHNSHWRQSGIKSE